MINNKEYLTLKHDVLVKFDKYSNHINTNILYMLKQESSKDVALNLLLQSFFAEDNDIIRLDYAEKILIQVTKANELNTDLFGKYINARHLFVLDILNELNFISFSINMIKDMYKRNYIKNNFEVLKMSEFSTHLIVSHNINNEFEDLKFDLYSKLMNELSQKISFASSKNVTDISSIVDTCAIAMLKHKEFGRQIIHNAFKAFGNYNVIVPQKNDSFKNNEDFISFAEKELLDTIDYLYG